MLSTRAIVVLLVNIVVKFVVRGERQQDAKARAEWEVDLRGRVDPHLDEGPKVRPPESESK